MSVNLGLVTLLSVLQTGDGRLKLLGCFGSLEDGLIRKGVLQVKPSSGLKSYTPNED